jgi:type VI protein secretion system component VasA
MNRVCRRRIAVSTSRPLVSCITHANTARPCQVGGEEKWRLLTHARHLSLHNNNATRICGRSLSLHAERSDNEINRKQEGEAVQEEAAKAERQSRRTPFKLPLKSTHPDLHNDRSLLAAGFSLPRGLRFRQQAGGFNSSMRHDFVSSICCLLSFQCYINAVATP